MTLERNTSSEMRLNALKKYKDYLEDLDKASVEVLYHLVQKGNTMEQWQDYMENLVNELGEGSSADDETVKKHI